MNRDGWYSADMHVHRDPAEIPLILRAEDLNFVPTITTHVWSTEVSQPWKWPSEFPVRVERNRFFTANARVVERIQGGPGAVILLAEGLPLPFEGYELYPPAVTYTLPLSAGSANGVKATPVGYDRVYVRLGKDRFEYPAFMGALKQGRSFSTNGPILELDADGRHGPGDRIEIRPGQEVRLRARTRSRGELEVLQLIVNGQVVAERTGQGVRELTLQKALRFDRSSWVAVRAFERSDSVESWRPAGLVFAHSSPLYFILEGKPVVVPESVQDLLQKIGRLIAYTERLDGFRQESHRKETLDVYRKAREVLSRRLVSP